MNIIRLARLLIKRWQMARTMKRYLNELLNVYGDALLLDPATGRKFAQQRQIHLGVCTAIANITLPELAKRPGKYQALDNMFERLMSVAGISTRTYIARPVCEAANLTVEMYRDSILIRIALILHLLKLVDDYKFGRKFDPVRHTFTHPGYFNPNVFNSGRGDSARARTWGILVGRQKLPHCT